MKKVIKAVLISLIIVLFVFDVVVAVVLAANVYGDAVIVDEVESITGDAWTPQELEDAGLSIDDIEVAEVPSNATTEQRLPRYENEDIIVQAQAPEGVDIICTPIAREDGVFYDIVLAPACEALICVEFKKLSANDGKVIYLVDDEEVDVTDYSSNDRLRSIWFSISL